MGKARARRDDHCGASSVSAIIPRRGGFTHGGAVERDTVGVMHQPVEDRIGEGWITDDVIPFFYRKLTYDDGGFAVVAVVHNFHQIASLAGGHLFRPPVIEDQNISAHDLSEEALETAVATGCGQFTEEAGHAELEGDLALPTCFMTQGTGQP